ncbi:hypothetical protein MNAN1_002957 [Malassezia nana]|uniref:Ribophorin II C-terminal domain-containing protein n=1 Tax=Malassezia nana TaxID=180528 RepID=A0AAF0ELG7_9BASI|nr:hypothetical protein MNAN1_002957 [Malassezia nana]
MKLTVSSFDGASRFRKTFDGKSSVPTQPEVVALEADDVIKLTFSTTLSNGEKATGDFLPHQAWVVIGDADQKDGSETVWPLRRVDRMSESLKRTIVKQGVDSPLRVFLVIASFPRSSNNEVQPLMLPLLDLQFSDASRFAAAMSESQRLKAEREEGFMPWPFNQHTFQTEPWQTMPPKMVSLSAALAVLGLPWAVLLTMWCRIVTHVSAPKTIVALFLASVYALEVGAFLHWIGVAPWIVFPAVGVVAIAALLTGRGAITPTLARSA